MAPVPLALPTDPRVSRLVCTALCLIVLSWGCATGNSAGQAKGRAATKPVKVEALSAVVLDAKQSDRARMKAAKGLAGLTDPKALDPIFSVVRDQDTRPLLRAAMTRLLARSPQREAVKAFLIERLADEQEAAEVRAAAIASLSILKDTSTASIARLRRAADDAEPSVRLAARSALARIGGDGIDRVALLIAILEDPAQPDAAKVPAVEQLGKFGDGRALPSLIQALAAKSPEGGPPQHLQEFLAARAAAKRNLPAAAARALGRLGDPAAIQPLIDASEQAQGEAKIAMFEALVTLKASQAVPAARAALSDPEPRVRRWAAILLRETSPKEALPEMRRALADKDPGVRLQATLALEQLNDHESVEHIRQAASRETAPEVRTAMEAAVRTLSPQ